MGTLPDGFFPDDAGELELEILGATIRPGYRVVAKEPLHKVGHENPNWVRHCSLMTRGTWAKFERPIKDLAYSMGYAIAVHGSLQRDIDLIAVPWIAEAADAEILVNAVCKLVNGYIRHEYKPADKPHGRMAWNIHLAGTFIDISVTPRQQEA